MRIIIMHGGAGEMSFIELKDVYKTYSIDENEIHAAQGVSFGIEKGEFVVLLGASGAGKTTILNILGGIDTATSGEVWVGDRNLLDLNTKQMTYYRRESVGFVFQFYNLIANLTAIENIELARQICPDPLDSSEMLEAVGLSERGQNFPAQLSGGEQQRVSIARALAKNPNVLLCDEPTGALDYRTGKTVLALLFQLCRERKCTVIVVTHNSAIAAMSDKTIQMKNGQVTSIQINPEPVPIEDIEW